MTPERPGALQVTGSLFDVQETWLKWVENVDPVERKRIAELFGEADLTGAKGVNRLCQSVMVEIISGGLSPAVAMALRSWLDVILANIDKEFAAAGARTDPMTTLAAMADLVKTLRPVRPVYTIADKGEVVEAEVEEKVKVAR